MKAAIFTALFTLALAPAPHAATLDEHTGAPSVYSAPASGFSSQAETVERGRKGSQRVGGKNSKGKGSRYVGGR